jgi:hypothetical protein
MFALLLLQVALLHMAYVLNELYFRADSPSADEFAGMTFSQ